MSEKKTWDDVEGLTEEERSYFKSFMRTDDVSRVSIFGTRVNGVELPRIEQGVVIRDFYRTEPNDHAFRIFTSVDEESCD